MTLCPGALMIGCKRCPIVNVCPAKSIIGDWKPEDKTSPKPQAPL